jgi:hypothetical protein
LTWEKTFISANHRSTWTSQQGISGVTLPVTLSSSRPVDEGGDEEESLLSLDDELSEDENADLAELCEQEQARKAFPSDLAQLPDPAERGVGLGALATPGLLLGFVPSGTYSHL